MFERINKIIDANNHESEVSIPELPLAIKNKKINLGTSYPYFYKTDYCRSYLSKNLEIGACEIKGSRPTQEDYLAVSVNQVKDFHKLSFDAQEIALKITFEKMQQNHGDYIEEGSTACIATAWIDDQKQMLHVTTANLGDSSAYIVILNSDHRIQTAKRLNTFHKPTDDSEYKRIKEENGDVFFGRLNGILALSRAFGDKKHENKGISHMPDISPFEQKLSEGQQAYVIVACDGLDNIKETEIGTILSKHWKKSPSTIANYLVRNAFANGSTDNISAAVIPVNKIPVSAAIFDGHGGSNVSNNLGKYFYPALQKEIQSVLIPSDFERIKEQLKVKQVALELAKNQQMECKEKNLLSNKFAAPNMKSSKYNAIGSLLFSKKPASLIKSTLAEERINSLRSKTRHC